MKKFRRLCLALSAIILLSCPTMGHSAPGIVKLDPEKGKIGPGTVLAVSFPTVMVGAEKIDAGDQASPLAFDPPLEGTFYWNSQTSGEFTVKGGLRPGQEYKPKLAADLKDQSGQPVAAPDLGAKFATEAFSASSDFEPTPSLSGLPQVEVDLTYPVRLADAPQHVYFQDRDSAERRPAEIGLRPDDDNSDSHPEGSILHVAPLAPLPVGRTFDLILDGLVEAKSGQHLPYLKRIPLGQTSPLRVNWLGAFNQPLAKPNIQAKFNDRIDPSSAGADALRVTPPVAGLKVRAEDDLLIAEGDFDRKQHYQVTIAPTIKSRRGYGLAAASSWGATFKPKISALFFPGPTILQRSRLGLKFAFMQVNAGALRWRLAELPFDKYPAVEARLREFEEAKKNQFTGQPIIDPDTGYSPPADTTLLVDAFSLPVRASGDFPATNGEEELLRELNWTPPVDAPVLSGLYLLEISGPALDDPTGKRIVGHRSIVGFSDVIITQKRGGGMVAARVARMSDAQPLPGVKVRAVTRKNYLIAAATTDQNGMASFPADALKIHAKNRDESANLFIADTPEGPAAQAVDAPALGDGYSNDENRPVPAQSMRGVIITDRPLYRPGQTVKIKGIVRLVDDKGRLTIPAGRSLAWSIPAGEQPIAKGETKISPDGGWEAEWVIPKLAKLGEYSIGIETEDSDVHQNPTGVFSVQEFKTPAFDVRATDATPADSAQANRTATLKIDSHFFSGQPNAGARVQWTALWEGAEGNTEEYTAHDEYSEHAAPISRESIPVKGETALDKDGLATLRAQAPANLNAARCRASWQVTVTSSDGQAISPTDETESTVLLQPALLGIQTLSTPGKGRSLRVRLAAFDRDNKPRALPPMRLEVFRVMDKTVKEKLAPFVVRYRNTAVFNPVKTQDVAPSADHETELDIPLERSGQYVAVASVPGQKDYRPISEQTYVGGDEPDEVAVENDASLAIHPDAAEYTPGQTAALAVQSPITGLAWVSVETDRILDTLLVPLRGNTGKLELPIKKEYAPNAHASVYLVRPGGADALPAERFGSVELKVRQPDWKLDVQPKTELPKVRPGEIVSGFVQVANAEKPIAGADVTVYAVDDAVLELGRWQPPNLLSAFYPERSHEISTYSGLRDYVAAVKRESLFQKGFTVGGGDVSYSAAGDSTTQLTRKDFRALAMWQTNLKTDAQGRAAFSFIAPDDLTRYRIVALAQTRASQFGMGSGTVEISKPLIAQPALPRFLRAGDEVELRAVVRQSELDQDNVAVRCLVGHGLKLLGAAEQTAPARRDLPAVFRFRAKVADVASVKVGFQAMSASGDARLRDAVEITLPVYPPTLLRRESVAGTFSGNGGGPADSVSLMPEEWKRGAGVFDAAVSVSPYLARLSGLPAILEYPHGCFEQISTRLLVCTMMNDLLAYLPEGKETAAGYRATVEQGIKLYMQSLLRDGSLPYWAGEKDGNDFVTLQAAWSVSRAAAAHYTIPDGLAEKLIEAVERILTQHSNDSSERGNFLRAFALLVCDREKGGNPSPEDAAAELYRARAQLGDEGRAMLALAMARFEIMPQERLQLVREIDYPEPPKPHAFDAAAFSSPTRAEAMMLLAINSAAPGDYLTPRKVAALRERLLALLDRAPEFSTQENFWSLFALLSFQQRDQAAKGKLPSIRPAPALVSANGASAAWTGIDLSRANGFRLDIPGSARASGKMTYLLRASYRARDTAEDAERRDRGLRVERVVHNLTDATRTGQLGVPIQVNDRLLITYRLHLDKRCDYLALVDELPAGVETVNAELPMFAGFYQVPPAASGARTLDLSSSELKDQKTCLYFDRVDAGAGEYSVLARANAAGSFRWPGTQASPMYEPLTIGQSAGGQLEIAAEKP